ncbi:hypothetical protein LMG23992_01132 [Cupriavidus laharis]|uniref:VWA domain-containing protein n=1 Tax=Cupriavidus laharis TaxID=151654 RepID=A0ABM8WM23_9BURK|nr:VWA domain-containing protein [Cupriavidus laharis]CAG9168442.1 hypothetical protein LMG23992_01132 [Cupriavidus laharis]
MLNPGASAIAAPAEAGLDAMLLARYAGFAGWLRENGFHVSSADVADALQVALRMGQLDSRLLCWSLRALLCTRAEEWRRFDDLFDSYFRVPNRRAMVQSRASGAGLIECDASAVAPQDGGTPLGPADSANDDSVVPPGGMAGEGATRHASPEYADLRHLNRADDLAALDEAVRRFAQRLRAIQVRRERSAAQGRIVDLGATIRRSVSSGGMPLELAWRQKRRVQPRLVLLLDVSRSMSPYAFFFLRLARVLGARVADVHAFVFHTRLVNVAQALRDPDPWRSQERLELLSEGWAGGTRIGDSLADFNQRHAAALLHSRTAAVIVSDGYDAGDPTVLQQALARLRRRCRCLVWLNPLAGRPGYAPTSAGMSAALPYLDLFAGVRDLASLERVLPQILSVLQ